MTFCDADDKQSENLIAWSLPHTAERRPPQLLEWRLRYGTVKWTGNLQDYDHGPRTAEEAGPGVASPPGPPAQREGERPLPGVQRQPQVRRHREIGNAEPPPPGKANGLEKFGKVWNSLRIAAAAVRLGQEDEATGSV